MISTSADFGRILGASAVFYYHIGIVTRCPLSGWGEYAVGFFIILSAIAYTGFSSAKPTDFASYSRYIAHRARAIFPMFVAINCAIFVASFCYPSALGRPFTFTELALSSTGLSQYCDHRYLSTVMWFVPFIMQVYLILPMVDYILQRASGVLVIVAAFSVSLSLIALVFSLWPLHAVEICRNWSVIFRLPEVCIGVILGRCIFSRSSRRAGLAALATFGFLSVMLATTFASHFPPEAGILSLPWNGLIVTAAISATAMAAAAMIGKVSTGTTRLFGAASFPFYLAHGIGILFVFRRFGASPPVWIIYFALCWSAAIAFTLIFRYVERSTRHA